MVLPPVAKAGWSEFIKDFGIGCLRGSRSQFRVFGDVRFWAQGAHQGPRLPDCWPSQKYLAAKSPSRTVPETANMTTILIKFCVAIDIVDAAYAGGRLVFD